MPNEYILTDEIVEPEVNYVRTVNEILIIPDFGEDFYSLPKKPKCKDYATSYHDI